MKNFISLTSYKYVKTPIIGIYAYVSPKLSGIVLVHVHMYDANDQQLLCH